MRRSVVTLLLLVNGLAFLIELNNAGPLIGWLALWPYGLFASLGASYRGSYPFFPWQLVTYAFLHGSVLHLFLNMYALWLFGSRLEYLWGGRRFAFYYLTCVIGAALIQLVVSEITLLQGGAAYPVLGASGGVFGLLLAFGVLFPETELLLLFPPIPIKAKWFVLGYGAIELFAGVTGTVEGVAHFAHLGGMLTGWLLLSHWRRSSRH
jgi:membrane associated rhomboid family serine protease